MSEGVGEGQFDFDAFKGGAADRIGGHDFNLEGWCTIGVPPKQIEFHLIDANFAHPVQINPNIQLRSIMTLIPDNDNNLAVERLIPTQLFPQFIALP